MHTDLIKCCSTTLLPPIIACFQTGFGGARLSFLQAARLLGLPVEMNRHRLPYFGAHRLCCFSPPALRITYRIIDEQSSFVIIAARLHCDTMCCNITTQPHQPPYTIAGGVSV